MSHYYTKLMLSGEPKRERVRYFTGIAESVSQPLDQLITDARDRLQEIHGFSDVRAERVVRTPEGRYRIELTCFH